MGKRRGSFAVGLALALALVVPSGAWASSANPSPVDAGATRVGQPKTASVSVTTANPAVGQVVTVTEGGGEFQVASAGACTTTTLSKTCPYTVTFTPSTAGPRSGKLSFNDAISADPGSVDLTGTGTQPVATLDAPTAFAFGPITLGQKSAGQSTKIRNTGTAPLTISSIALGGANPADFVLGYCVATPITLGPGQECFVAALFQPTSEGDKSATISIATDGGVPTVTLSGTGVAPPPPQPLVSITSPKRNTKVKRSTKVRRKKRLVTVNRKVTFKGLASDKDGLARVEVALVRGTSVPASPKFVRAKVDDFAWSYALPTSTKLKAGTYMLVARATDLTGVRSELATVSFKLA